MPIRPDAQKPLVAYSAWLGDRWPREAFRAYAEAVCASLHVQNVGPGRAFGLACRHRTSDNCACSSRGEQIVFAGGDLSRRQTRPLSRALQKVWFFRFFEPGPKGSGGLREPPRPQSYLWAFPGPPGDSRRPPGIEDKPKQKT